jgi:hypothetical protein
MLEYLRLDEGRRAGLTSSPDFFLTSGGLTRSPSSESSSLSSDGDSVTARSGMMMAVSVDDLECVILRAVALSAVGEWMVVVGSEKETPLAGDPSRLSSMDRTACSSAPQVWEKLLRPLGASEASSPSEFSDESGGDKMAPVGINRLFTGVGDWRMLPLLEMTPSIWRTVLESSSTGDCGRPAGSCWVTEGPRRCLFR